MYTCTSAANYSDKLCTSVLSHVPDISLLNVNRNIFRFIIGNRGKSIFNYIQKNIILSARKMITQFTFLLLSNDYL